MKEYFAVSPLECHETISCGVGKSKLVLRDLLSEDLRQKEEQ